jgi:hypothetical protein
LKAAATPAGPDFAGGRAIQETDRAAVAAVEGQQGLKVPGRLPLPDAGRSPDTKTPPIDPDEDDDRAGQAPAPKPRQLRTDGASWARYKNARFGFSLRYPAHVFALEAARTDNFTTHFRSRDGQATLRILATSNLPGRTLAQYRAALIKERYRDVKFDYAPQRDTWFVLSGIAGNDIFYERVTLACDRRSLHGWMLVFPSSERSLYEPIIEEMHRKYRHSNGPGARCGALKPEASAGAKASGGETDGSL